MPTIFAYGSNCSRAVLEGRVGRVHDQGLGHIGRLGLVFAGHGAAWGGGVATLADGSPDGTWGRLWRLTDEQVKALDGYEGCPRVYSRETMRVWSGNAQDHVNAEVYIMRDRRPARPSEAYLSTIATGLAETRFRGRGDYLADAETRSNWRGGTSDVFVYGTLRAGEVNHHRLAGSQFETPAELQPGRWRMRSLGAYPILCAEEGAPAAVRGEIYRVTDAVLRGLDRLEGHPGHYERRLVLTGTGRVVWTYVWPRFSAAREIHSGDWRAGR